LLKPLRFAPNPKEFSYMKKLSTVFALSLIAFASVGVAQAKLTGSGGEASFTAVGPAGLKIVGSTTQITVKEDGSNVVVSVPLATVDTGIGLRNKHMKEKYLETDKYPNAELTVARDAVKEGSGSAQGTMKIHGKTKAVTFSYSAKKDGTTFAVTGSVRININDFGVEVPSYLGVTVKPDVDVAVKFSASDN
jgi:polyisoprenoid-binding protein YceI